MADFYLRVDCKIYSFTNLAGCWKKPELLIRPSLYLVIVMSSSWSTKQYHVVSNRLFHSVLLSLYGTLFILSCLMSCREIVTESIILSIFLSPTHPKPKNSILFYQPENTSMNELGLLLLTSFWLAVRLETSSSFMYCTRQFSKIGTLSAN